MDGEFVSPRHTCTQEGCLHPKAFRFRSERLLSARDGLKRRGLLAVAGADPETKTSVFGLAPAPRSLAPTRAAFAQTMGSGPRPDEEKEIARAG